MYKHKSKIIEKQEQRMQFLGPLTRIKRLSALDMNDFRSDTSPWRVRDTFGADLLV